MAPQPSPQMQQILLERIAQMQTTMLLMRLGVKVLSDKRPVQPVIGMPIVRSKA